MSHRFAHAVCKPAWGRVAGVVLRAAHCSYVVQSFVQLSELVSKATKMISWLFKCVYLTGDVDPLFIMHNSRRDH